MAEVKVVVREAPVDDRHEPTGPPKFEVTLVWWPLYLIGGTTRDKGRPVWQDGRIWHVLDQGKPVRRQPVCGHWTGYSRRQPMTRLEAEAHEQTWRRTYRYNRLCKSCERILNARARERGVR